MLSFVKHPNGKESAQEGKHDDLVMATCIAHFVGKQGSFTWSKGEVKEEYNILDEFKPKKEKKTWSMAEW